MGHFGKFLPGPGPANFDEKVFDSEFDEIVRVRSYQGAKHTVAILGPAVNTTPSSECFIKTCKMGHFGKFLPGPDLRILMKKFSTQNLTRLYV